MKVVILDGYTSNPGDLSWDRFKEDFEVTIYDRTSEEMIVERIGDAEIVLTNKTVINEDVLKKCNSIKYIGVLATGYNVVDVNFAKEKGIVVTNVPAYSTKAVAQLVFALLLEICHNVGQHNSLVKNGKWSACQDFSMWEHPLIELADKTMGIVGWGQIGQATAKLAQAFGMKVLVYNKNPKEINESDTLKKVKLDDLLKNSDVVSLHCPQKEDTVGLIDKNTLAKMKPSAILINTSRGGLVNEQDLADALNDGKIFGAAVDVVSFEPIKDENPLLKCDKCVITPHIAWAPKEARIRLLDIAFENLDAFKKGEIKNNVY